MTQKKTSLLAIISYIISGCAGSDTALLQQPPGSLVAPDTGNNDSRPLTAENKARTLPDDGNGHSKKEAPETKHVDAKEVTAVARMGRISRTVLSTPVELRIGGIANAPIFGNFFGPAIRETLGLLADAAMIKLQISVSGTTQQSQLIAVYIGDVQETIYLLEVQAERQYDIPIASRHIKIASLLGSTDQRLHLDDTLISVPISVDRWLTANDGDGPDLNLAETRLALELEPLSSRLAEKGRALTSALHHYGSLLLSIAVVSSNLVEATDLQTIREECRLALQLHDQACPSTSVGLEILQGFSHDKWSDRPIKMSSDAAQPFRRHSDSFQLFMMVLGEMRNALLTAANDHFILNHLLDHAT